jgi:signal transduction histidine kinase
MSQKMEAIGTLAGGIAHDFNNILGAILGYAELALLDLPKTDPVYGNLEEILKAGQRARDLVRQILAFSRKLDKKDRPVEIGGLTKEILKPLRSSTPSAVEIITDFPSQEIFLLRKQQRMKHGKIDDAGRGGQTIIRFAPNR